MLSLKGGTNETLLAKFNSHHQGSAYYRVPATKQSVFTIVHYAGKVKYLVTVGKTVNILFHILLTLYVHIADVKYFISVLLLLPQHKNT